MSYSSLELICFFVINASFIKSAQIGYHIWLPDSMDAPVPASALIHSATLVSAGVYLLCRMGLLLQLSLVSSDILIFIGSLTAAYGSITSFFQSDMKKILAYSTISNCGYMVVLCATYNYAYVISYLYVHGLFKAILFMCIGNLIRVNMTTQDIRHSGGLSYSTIFEEVVSVFCLMQLSGAPFSMGFYTKHIIFATCSENSSMYFAYLTLCIISGIFGTLYSCKLYIYLFYDYTKLYPAALKFLESNIENTLYFNPSSNMFVYHMHYCCILSYTLSYIFVIGAYNKVKIFYDEPLLAQNSEQLFNFDADLTLKLNSTLYTLIIYYTFLIYIYSAKKSLSHMTDIFPMIILFMLPFLLALVEPISSMVALRYYPNIVCNSVVVIGNNLELAYN